MNEPSLMSASDDLTMAEIRSGSASFTVRFSPLRDLTDRVLPSTLVDRRRARAPAAPAAPKPATTLPTSPTSMQAAGAEDAPVSISASYPPWKAPGGFVAVSAHVRNPRPAKLIPLDRAKSASISARNSAVTCGRTPNHSKKPRTAWCSSMPSPSAVARPRRARGGKQLGFERCIDQVCHHGFGRQRRKVDVERWLAGHAERAWC